MENKGLKVIGTAVVVAGLMTGTFLGGLTIGDKSGAEPEIIPTSAETQIETSVAKEDGAIVLVGDEEEVAEEADAIHGYKDVEPTEEATGEEALVQVTPAPVETTPALPTPAAAPVNETPYVVSISPADDAVGVSPSANIVVTFSEAVDKTSAKAALDLSTSNCGAFSWDSDSTAMTFDPCADWAYGTEIQVKVGDVVADLEGQEMGNVFVSEFRVLRQTTQKLYSDPEADGYVWRSGNPRAGNTEYHVDAESSFIRLYSWSKGYLSFRLGNLPEDLIEIQSARVYAWQGWSGASAYADSRNVLIESVTFGQLTEDANNAAPHSLCAVVCLGSPPRHKVFSESDEIGWRSVDMLIAVRADWNERYDRSHKSQFRLQVSDHCSGSNSECGQNGVAFESAEGIRVHRPYLLITYLHP